MQGELFTCTLLLVYPPFSFAFAFTKLGSASQFLRLINVCRPQTSSHIAWFGIAVEPLFVWFFFKKKPFLSCFIEKELKDLPEFPTYNFRAGF